MDTVLTGSKASKGRTGESVRGRAVVVNDPKDMDKFQEGDILVTYMTDPDFVPMMSKAGAVVTEIGGRLCHAAIVSRELGIPAVVIVKDARSLLNGKDVTVNGTTAEVVVHG